MTPSQMETFEVSTPTMPPGLPRLFRQRLLELGPGEQADRTRLEHVCGSASAANHFLHKATDLGAVLPVAWGRYQVARERTLACISQLEDPVLQRFIAWALELPDLADGPVHFVSPWLWRDTDLKVTKPMPLIPLDPDEQVVEGAPPQWDAFHMDLEEEREWTLLLGDEEVGSFSTPGPLAVVLVLRASLDPRGKVAADRFDAGSSARGLGRELNRLWLEGAPRGGQKLRTVKGPPARRRLLAPPWYMDMVTRRAPMQGNLSAGSG